jgi:glycosyltransferase involved in cell wall biosynthesis
MDPVIAPARHQLRVLHVITRLVVGGAQQNTLLTVDRLDRTRYTVALACGPSGGPEGTLEPQARSLDVPYFEIPTLVRNPHPVKDIAAFITLLRLMRRGHYDIVHTHTTKAGILGRLAARAARVPVIVHTPHGHAFQGYLRGSGSRALLLVERALGRITDGIICLTDAEMRDHLEAGVGRRSQYSVIHSGVDLDRIKTAAQLNGSNGSRPQGLPGKGPLIGCIARLVPVKGIATLIQAIPQITKEVPDAFLVLIGDGPQRSELRAEASRLGVLDRVAFLGLRHDVPELLPFFDLVVLPSINEGMGKAAVEAMAAGRPVVGSRIVGIKDVVVDGRTGLLFPPGDSRALAQSVVRLLLDPALSAAFGQAGSKEASRYSINTMVQQITALYESLYAERGRPHERSDSSLEGLGHF